MQITHILNGVQLSLHNFGQVEELHAGHGAVGSTDELVVLEVLRVVVTGQGQKPFGVWVPFGNDVFEL